MVRLFVNVSLLGTKREYKVGCFWGARTTGEIRAFFSRVMKGVQQ